MKGRSGSPLRPFLHTYTDFLCLKSGIEIGLISCGGVSFSDTERFRGTAMNSTTTTAPAHLESATGFHRFLRTFGARLRRAVELSAAPYLVEATAYQR
jgi:hypothetical protein